MTGAGQTAGVLGGNLRFRPVLPEQPYGHPKYIDKYGDGNAGKKGGRQHIHGVLIAGDGQYQGGDVQSGQNDSRCQGQYAVNFRCGLGFHVMIPPYQVFMANIIPWALSS